MFGAHSDAFGGVFLVAGERTFALAANDFGGLRRYKTLGACPDCPLICSGGSC
jgi:hypothetical protein